MFLWFKTGQQLREEHSLRLNLSSNITNCLFTTLLLGHCKQSLLKKMKACNVKLSVCTASLLLIYVMFFFIGGQYLGECVKFHCYRHKGVSTESKLGAASVAWLLLVRDARYLSVSCASSLHVMLSSSVLIIYMKGDPVAPLFVFLFVLHLCIVQLQINHSQLKCRIQDMLFLMIL